MSLQEIANGLDAEVRRTNKTRSVGVKLNEDAWNALLWLVERNPTLRRAEVCKRVLNEQLPKLAELVRNGGAQ